MPFRGILLLGVPGTGKSHFAKALGNQVGWPCLSLNLGKVFGSLVGESEAKMRDALKVVDAMAPCVLFLDEIEKGLAGGGRFFHRRRHDPKGRRHFPYLVERPHLRSVRDRYLQRL
ncbi:MAG: AAA family ATPase [Proteobacteria bacterium]|nr:AAA family ATPase [Pseudomonadota bacterium]MBU4448273.1 AAA family ATPase [Pseudomonadota bacterium]